MESPTQDKLVLESAQTVCERLLREEVSAAHHRIQVQAHLHDSINMMSNYTFDTRLARSHA